MNQLDAALFLSIRISDFVRKILLVIVFCKLLPVWLVLGFYAVRIALLILMFVLHGCREGQTLNTYLTEEDKQQLINYLLSLSDKQSK